MGVRAKTPLPAHLALCLNLAFRKVRLRPLFPGLDPQWRPHGAGGGRGTGRGCSILTRDSYPQPLRG